VTVDEARRVEYLLMLLQAILDDDPPDRWVDPRTDLIDALDAIDRYIRPL
jgi:hypothetical protein